VATLAYIIDPSKKDLKGKEAFDYIVKLSKQKDTPILISAS